METIDMLINEIESEVLKAKKAAFSSTDIIVDKRRMLDLISRFRNNYPQVITEAQSIKAQRDKIMQDAEAYASKTIATAQQQAEQLIDQTDVMQQAKADAEAMRAEAEENYRKKDYESRALAFQILDGAEKSLKDSMGIINDKKRKLVQE